MNIECMGCHHHYDVSKYKPGQRLRCTCGQILVVPESGVRSHVVQTFHCATCGGAIEMGAKNCPFCHSVVDLSSARLTVYCPHCYAMSPEGATYCSGCGQRITAKLDTPALADEVCPRCNVQMRARDIETHKTMECPVCLGMFVEVDTFETLIRTQEKRIGDLSAPQKAEKSTLKAEAVTYIKCPICKKMMNRMNYGRISGVIVDYCRDHGYWLDDGELGKIAKWVATGGFKEKYQLEIDEAKAEKSRVSMDKIAVDAEQRNLITYRADERRSPLEDGVNGFIRFVSRLFD